MTVGQSNETEIRRIVGAVEQARMDGRHEEAQRLLSQAQALAPDHPLVLNEAGIHQLRAGNAAAARRFLESAIAKDDRNPGSWLNLATTFRKLDLAAEEMNALERVLALEPRHLLGLLQKGSLLERQGKSKAAAQVFHNALLTIPPGTKLPEFLRPAIQRATTAVRDNLAALEAYLSDQLRGLRQQHASASQERFDHCLGAFLGKSRIYHPEPTFLHFPKLPALEFYPRAEFPWLDKIEAATAEIRAEFERVFAQDAGRLEPYIAYPQGVPLDQWAELNHSRRWSAFFLWRDGAPVEAHQKRCPRTAELLAQAPLADVPGYAPAVFFSILDAKSHIPAHTGVTNTRLIVHLPLVIPPGCRFRVGSQTREWQTGQAWVFDDTIDHEAWNDSDVPRAILIFDIWNRFMSPAECDLVRSAVRGISDYYGDELLRTTSD
jgi:aspartyl/asparaginyl beta-hydroxylase (cupin superfamily)